MPVAGRRVRAANRAACVRSSAGGTSRSILARLVISRGCSIRQAARIARWVSAAVTTAEPAGAGSTRAPSDGAQLALAFPARHVVLVQLHELARRGQGLF